MASSTVFEEHPAAPIGLALERSERQSERGRKNPAAGAGLFWLFKNT